jgi:hypothetical protein
VSETEQRLGRVRVARSEDGVQLTRPQTEEIEAPQAPPATRALGPETVLRRQRAAGNAATIRSLAIGGPRLMRLVTLTAEDEAAIVEQLHDAMAGWGTDEEAIYVVLQKLGKDATAITKLKKAYKDKYGDDLEAELRSEMSGDELRLALELIGVIDDPSKGPKVGAAPGTPAEFSAAAKRLYAAMKGWGTDEEEVYAVLLPFKRDPAALATLKTTYQTDLSGGLTGKGLEEDIKDEMSSDELSYALYLLNAPPPRPATGTSAIPDPGTEVHKGAVPGGEVSVRTGVQLDAAGDKEGYSIGYKGGLSSDSAWLQFIWREVEVEHPTKGGYRVNPPHPITTSGGSYRLTTDPSAPNYNTDSNKPDDPFYEAGFMADRTADSTTMFDEPSPMNPIVQGELAGGATKVTSRAHFNTYLIRDNRAIYHVGLDVEWVYTTPAVPPRTQTVRSSGKVTGLPEGMRKRLIEQRPRFEYIQ